jgi:hypothetical protein
LILNHAGRGRQRKKSECVQALETDNSGVYANSDLITRGEV